MIAPLLSRLLERQELVQPCEFDAVGVDGDCTRFRSPPPATLRTYLREWDPSGAEPRVSDPDAERALARAEHGQVTRSLRGYRKMPNPNFSPSGEAFFPRNRVTEHTDRFGQPRDLEIPEYLVVVEETVRSIETSVNGPTVVVLASGDVEMLIPAQRRVGGVR